MPADTLYTGYWCLDCQSLLEAGCTTCEHLWPEPKVKHHVERVEVVLALASD